MKKLFHKAKELVKKAVAKSDEILLKISVAIHVKLGMAKKKLAENTGAFGEQGTWIVIVVVIAGILLTLLVALIKNKIFPSVEGKVDEFFQTT